MNVLYILGRDRKLIEILLSQQGDVSIKELAMKLDVSTRTIHRDLKNVENILSHYNLALNKKSGVGIHIEGNEEEREKLKLVLLNSNPTNYTPEERQAIIFASLLQANEPIKLFTLADELFVTNATISNDLDVLTSTFERHHLQLIRKRGFGVKVEGKEEDKRSALSYLISKYVDEFDLLSLLRENIEKKTQKHLDSVSNRLLGLVDKGKLLVIEKSVDSLKDELPYELADSSYIGLVVHLALAIERLHQGGNIHFDPNHLQEIKDSEEYKIAEKLISKLEQAFEMDIPADEIGYITMHLLGAKLRYDNDYVVEETTLDLAYRAKELIQFVSGRVNANLLDQSKLLIDLVAHLKPTIFRLNQGMNIKNPLLHEIEEDYRPLFSILEEGVDEVFPNINFPKEEIGYLVLHFASALLHAEGDVSLRALVVCSSGIGTSKMLASRIVQHIPEVKEVDNRSLFELESMDLSTYDLIVSTVPLQNLEGKYILASPILTKKELQSVESYVKKLKITYRTKEPTKQLKPKQKVKDKRDVLNRVEQIHQYSTLLIGLLQRFFVEKIKDDLDIKGALTKICVNMEKRQWLGHYKEVLHDLIERAEIGGIAIPGTSLALYHTRSPNIKAPTFTVHVLPNTESIKGMDGESVNVDTILLMLAPKDTDEATLELLSHISSLIIQDEESMKVFQSKNDDAIASFVSTNLYQWLSEKFTS